MYRQLICKTLILAIAATAMPVLAQTPAAQNGLGGPVIPGVCLMSREAVLVNSAAGKAATARLQQLTGDVQKEIETERTQLNAEVEQLRKDQASLSADQRKTREQGVTAKLTALQAKADLRSREIEATRVKALDRISNEAQPVIADVYKQKGCGLLVDRNSVLGGNLTNDITTAVVQGLDARLATITFNRETLASPAAK